MEYVKFGQIKQDQELNWDLEYGGLVKLIQKMIYQVQTRQSIATMILDNYAETAVLKFQQDGDFRVIDLFEIDFQESDVESIKNSITYRINSKTQMNMLVNERLRDITKIIEQKNPTLLKEIRKGAHSGGGLGNSRHDEPNIRVGM